MKVRINSIKKLTLGILLAAAVFQSCKKMTEAEAYSLFPVAEFFKSMPEAYAATLGVYQAMVSPFTYNYNIPLMFDKDSDLEFLTPGLTYNDFREVSHYYFLPTNKHFYETWSMLYAGIDRANLVLDRIPKMELYNSGTDNEKRDLNRMIGEAKFLRGFYYSELVRLWGDVPYKTKFTETGDKLSNPLTDKYEIYTNIIKDIQEAIEVLPAALPTDERINKFGAKAMLARIALFAGGYSLATDGTMKRPANYLEYYQLAKANVDDVIASGLYQLNPIYGQVYKNQSQQIFDPKENLFEAAYYTSTNTVTSSSSIGTFNAPRTALGVYNTTLYRTLVTTSFYASFDSADTRRDFSVARYSLNANGIRTPLLASDLTDEWAPGKWSREHQLNSATERSYTNINYVFMRYADVLLMKAEIENELNNGPTQAAYDAINAVRHRAFGLNVQGNSIDVTITAEGSGYSGVVPVTITGGGGVDASAVATVASGKITALTLLNRGMGYTSAPVVTIGGNGTGATALATLLPKITQAEVDLPVGITKSQFLTMIENERAWELCFEGMRKADLIRWNMLGDKLAATEAELKALRSNYPYVAGSNFQKGKHELYPYPTNETDANPAITRQNPGY